MTPYTLNDWPRDCGFEFDPIKREWTRGDYRLLGISRTVWKLYRSPTDETGELITTRCRSADAIVSDLRQQLRDKTGGQQS